jgi:type II secretory pathway pseudopilin PulG
MPPTRSGRINSSVESGEAGFSLLEAIVSVGLMAGALASLGQMLVISIAMNQSARDRSDATVLAQQKMEQLLVESPSGGTGLSPLVGGSLTSNMDGWFDYVDRSGQSLGGSEALGGGVYTRRWAVEPLPSSPADALVVHVLVATRLGLLQTASTNHPRDQILLSSIKASGAQ